MFRPPLRGPSPAVGILSVSSFVFPSARVASVRNRVMLGLQIYVFICLIHNRVSIFFSTADFPRTVFAIYRIINQPDSKNRPKTRIRPLFWDNMLYSNIFQSYRTTLAERRPQKPEPVSSGPQAGFAGRCRPARRPCDALRRTPRNLPRRRAEGGRFRRTGIINVRFLCYNNIRPRIRRSEEAKGPRYRRGRHDREKTAFAAGEAAPQPKEAPTAERRHRNPRKPPQPRGRLAAEKTDSAAGGKRFVRFRAKFPPPDGATFGTI